MRNDAQVPEYVPYLIARRHPFERAVEARKIYRPRVGAEGLFAGRVVIVLEVTHREFPDGGVDGFARAQTGVIGLRHRAPAPMGAIHRQHMVGIAHGFKIHQ